jgi:hypothetical protein
MQLYDVYESDADLYVVLFILLFIPTTPIQKLSQRFLDYDVLISIDVYVSLLGTWFWNMLKAESCLITS